MCGEIDIKFFPYICAYKLNNCGPFILFIKVQCIFASLHQSAKELQKSLMFIEP